MSGVKINNTDLEITRINLGGNVFRWTLDEAQPFVILDQFIKNEGNFIDIADTYPCGQMVREDCWSLAAGFLTGKYRSEADLNKSMRGAGAKRYLNERRLTVLDALDKVSQKYSRSHEHGC